jgi:hypothetical protein
MLLGIAIYIAIEIILETIFQPLSNLKSHHKFGCYPLINLFGYILQYHSAIQVACDFEKPQLVALEASLR